MEWIGSIAILTECVTQRQLRPLVHLGMFGTYCTPHGSHAMVHQMPVSTTLCEELTLSEEIAN